MAENVLTKEIAEQFLADEESVDLEEFTAIEDEAAEIIGKLSVDPFFAGQNNTAVPWIDLSNVRTLSVVALASLRPELRQLADIFCQRMAEPLEELNNSGKSWLETNEDTAIAGFSALLGAWCDSSSADEVLWIASEQPRTGNDVFGDSLTAHRLYFCVTEHFLDDEGKSDLTQCLNRFLDISSWPSDEVTQGGECVGDRGFYVPVDRLCEFFSKNEWPHTHLNSGALSLGLTELTVEHASAVSQMPGDEFAKVILHQVSELSQECADMLAQGTANVSLPGLKSIPHTASHWTLVQRMAEFDDELMFLQLEEVNEELAQDFFDLCKSHTGLSLGTPVLTDECLSILIRIQGYFGWGVAELSDSQAEILCKHNADLSLDEMTSLSDEAATLLSEFPYGLSIDLDNLPESAADILRSHPSLAEEEDDENEGWDDDDEA